MPNVYEPLVLEIEPPYIGSAFSPTVDIDETADDITVTITDFRGDHSYTVEKTDQAIEDAEQAATNANQAATQATATANAAAQYARDTADQAAQDAQETADAAAGRADTAAASANQAAQAANAAATTANTAAANADAKAALADSKAALANTAATTANNAAEAAEAAKTAANTAAGQATTAAGNATTAAGTANTAATNADAKAQLADTAATNADTATQAANTATTNATNAAQAANNAADVAIEAAEDMPRLIGTVDSVQTVADVWPTTIESATVYGKSVQDGTPTPSAPVEVQVVGAPNVLRFTPGSETKSGVTSEILEDGTWKLSGTATVNTNFYYTPNSTIAVKVGDTFALSGMPTDGYGVNGWRVALSGSGYFSTPNGTITSNSAGIRGMHVQVYEGKNMDGWQARPMMVCGTHPMPYVKPGSIGLQTGENVTPIDLQGHTLAGLPDGTLDVLRVDSVGRAWIEANTTTYVFTGADIIDIALGTNAYTGTILYDNLNWGSGYCSMCTTELGTTGVRCKIGAANKRIYFQNAIPNLGANLADVKAYFDANPVTVVCKGEPQTIELGTITPPDIAPGDTLAIYASLDPDWQIRYTQDPSIVVNTLQASIAPVEGSTASTNYAVGAYLMHANQLYRVTSAIATGEAITPGSNCVACTVMGEVIRLTA